MKVNNAIGSKERFLEMFQGINKIRINENFNNNTQTPTYLIEKAFNDLKKWDFKC